MCERRHATQFRVQVWYEGRMIGESFHWDKPAANRTFDKQVRKSGVTAIMYSPEGKRLRG